MFFTRESRIPGKGMMGTAVCFNDHNQNEHNVFTYPVEATAKEAVERLNQSYDSDTSGKFSQNLAIEGCSRTKIELALEARRRNFDLQVSRADASDSNNIPVPVVALMCHFNCTWENDNPQIKVHHSKKEVLQCLKKHLSDLGCICGVILQLESEFQLPFVTIVEKTTVELTLEQLRLVNYREKGFKEASQTLVEMIKGLSDEHKAEYNFKATAVRKKEIVNSDDR